MVLILVESEACYMQKLLGPLVIFLYGEYTHVESPYRECVLQLPD